MPSIKIQIGASVNSSVATAFTQITKAAHQAAATIKTQMAAAGAAAGKSAAPFKQVGTAATQAAAATKTAAA